MSQPTQPKKQCSIDGCDAPARGRGWCQKHWKRWRKYGDPLGKSNFKQIKRDCQIQGCDRPYHANGYCGYHGYRAKKYGDPLAQGPGRHTGRKRMKNPSYAGVHKRLLRDIGKATQFDCSDCGNQAEEWSYNGGAPDESWWNRDGIWMAYTTNQNYYSPRCKKCHRRHDESLTRERDHTGKFTGTPEWIRPLDGTSPADHHNPPGAHITITTQENQ